MKIYNLLYLLIFLPGVIFAQSNYHPGYIITLSGDTTRGSINYREWSLNPDQVEFKPSGTDASPVQVNPAGIRKFVISDLETYLSFTGNISADRSQSTNSTNGLDIRTAADTTRINRSVFLRLLTTGEHLSLYSYADKDKIRFFFTEGVKPPVELEYHEFYDEDVKQIGYIKQIRYVEVFKSQLIDLSGRHSTDVNMLDEIQSVKYAATDLVNFFDKLNKVSQAYKKLHHRTFTRFFAGITADATTTHYTKQLRLDLNTAMTSTTVMPGFNAGFDVSLNPNVERFIFRSDISVSYNKPSLNYSYSDNVFMYYERYTLNQFTVSGSPKLIYNLYNRDKFKLFMGGGLSLNYSLSWNHKLTTTYIATGYSNNTETKNPFSILPLWISFPIIAGIRLKQKMEISVTYFPTSLYPETNGYKVGNSRISVGLTYHFRNQ